MADMNYWLGRKYAILQQNADATSQNAATSAMSAEAGAGLTRAQTAGTLTQNQFIPQVTMADIAQTRANTGLIGAQAAALPLESAARIRASDAGANFTNTQNKVLTRESLDEMRVAPGSLASVLGRTTPSLGSLGYEAPSATRPRRLPGESQADYMDRTGWGL